MDRTQAFGISQTIGVKKAAGVSKAFGVTRAVEASVVFVLVALALVLTGCGKSQKPLVVGSKNFTEQVVLGEIIAQHLENRLTRKISRQFNLGGTLLTYQALLGGQIALYPEYTGTIQAEILKETPRPDAAQALLYSRQELRRIAQIEVMDPLGVDNFFAMVIRGEDARKYHLENLSQAADVKDGWKLGMGYEFQQRIDGMPALDQYRLPMASAPRSMDLGLMYKALELGQVSMIAANATDGPLAAHDWTILKDDRKVFGSYQACILARADALAGEPQLKPALQELSGKLNNEVMRKLDAAVDVDHRQVREVAADFLRQAGLLNKH
jgi:osmoprotectant transport system substrate-binding protein